MNFNLVLSEQIQSLFNDSRQNWDSILDQSDKTSLYLRHADIQSPYTIDYQKNGQLRLHTKILIGQGFSKKIKLIADFATGKLYAKAVHKIESKTAIESKRATDQMLTEIAVQQKFSGKRGVVQIIDILTYPSKKNSKYEKIAIIEELYDEDLNDAIKKRQFTEEELKIITLDLLNGLLSFEESELVNIDIKPKNMVLKYDSDTNKVIKAAVCDLGFVMTRENLENKYESFLYRQRSMFAKIIADLFSQSNLPCPFLDNFYTTPANLKEIPCSAKEALEKAQKYFNV